MSNDLKLAIQAAKKAGEIIREDYAKIKKISKKSANDFVTQTDIKAEKAIIAELKKTGYSFLGEETGEINGQSNKKWIIDPIDGTNNFIRGVPLFAVSIALMKNNDLLIGVVYDPISKNCYFAEKSKGAYLNSKKIRVSGCEDLDEAIIVLEHNISKKSRVNFVVLISKLMKNNNSLILRHGLTALMICYVARGSAEAFLSSGDKLYDYAAGLVIAKEAGAIIGDWDGKMWNNSSSYIAVSNPGINDLILKKIAGIQKK